MSCLDAALQYAARGLRVIPVDGKVPCLKKWPELATTQPELIKRWFSRDYRGKNVGIVTGAVSGVFVLDIDPKSGGEDSLDALQAEHGRLPDTLQAITGSGGRHFYFKHPGGKVANGVAIRPGLDIRGEGGQVVAPPSLHASGGRYEWDGLDDFNCEILPAPAWLLELIAPKKKAAAAAAGAKAFTMPKAVREGGRNRTLFTLAASLRAKGLTESEMLAALLAANKARCAPPLSDDEVRTIAGSAGKYPPGAGGDSPARVTGGGYRWNETGNADRLNDRHGDILAHCEEREGFMVWTGRRWKFDRFVATEKLSEETMLAAYAEAAAVDDDKQRKEFLKFLNSSLYRKGLANMAHLTKKKVLQVSTNDFDRNPLLLNCQNGTVNLRTGKLQQHTQDDMLSKLIPFAYDPAASCPLFLKFLYQIMGGGPDVGSEEAMARAERLVNYLQRLFGCAATGKPEKLLIIFYGAGNNGKSTLLSIINSALGESEYAAQVNIESLMADPNKGGTSNAVNADLSDLQGARFVFSSEVDRGQKLAVSRVKYLTGLTAIKTRRLRENWIEFKPTWKLFLDCNDRPRIATPTDAIWNRVKCVPFTVTIPDEEIDTDLSTKLTAELPGILAWIVAGARRYIQSGLGAEPREVQASTKEYQESSDRLKEFIEDCCELHPDAWVSAARLNGAYSDWAAKNGDRYPLTSTSLAEQIKAKGCMPMRRARERGWRGIEIMRNLL